MANESKNTMNPFESFLRVCRLHAMARPTADVPVIEVQAAGGPYIAFQKWELSDDRQALAAGGYQIGTPENRDRIAAEPFGGLIEFSPVHIDDVPEEHLEELLGKIREFNAMFEPNKGPIRAELVSTNFYTRWECHACGGNTEKVGTLTEVAHGEAEGFRICETCLEAGDVPARMLRHADELEAWAQKRAASLRDIAPRLQWPAWAEFVRKEYGLSLAEYQARERRRQEEMQDVPF